jgi:hypothetical protein
MIVTTIDQLEICQNSSNSQSPQGSNQMTSIICFRLRPIASGQVGVRIFWLPSLYPQSGRGPTHLSLAFPTFPPRPNYPPHTRLTATNTHVCSACCSCKLNVCPAGPCLTDMTFCSIYPCDTSHAAHLALPSRLAPRRPKPTLLFLCTHDGTP